jgi:hypothetical protein
MQPDHSEEDGAHRRGSRSVAVMVQPRPVPGGRPAAGSGVLGAGAVMTRIAGAQPVLHPHRPPDADDDDHDADGGGRDAGPGASPAVPGAEDADDRADAGERGKPREDDPGS